MLLDNLQYNNDAFVHLERYVNCGSPSGFTEKFTTSLHTCAKGPGDEFHLCAIELPSGVVVESYGNIPKLFDQWQMIVHPDMINDSLFQVASTIDRKAVIVVPTSSSRTVKMVDQGGWFLKLCYKGLIGRADRQLGIDHAISAIEVSTAISEAIDNGMLSHDIYLLREVFSRVVLLPYHESVYEWGIVIREPNPYPANPSIKMMVPAFALFSQDEKNPDDPTLLAQLIKQERKPTEDYLVEDIVFPIFRAYFQLLLYCGLQIEAHAQNILFAFDENFNVLGVVVRDAESIDKDFSLMNDFEINSNFTDMKYKRLLRGQYNYSIMHSFMFDFKLGEYLIDPIIKEASNNFPVHINSLINRIRNYTRSYIKRLPPDFFPQDGCWYSYENIVHDQSKPRPYIAKDNPRYR